MIIVSVIKMRRMALEIWLGEGPTFGENYIEYKFR